MGETQKKLGTKSVAIIGCGGIGNLVSINLATAGIKELILIDDDEIEISNLTRQIMFEEKDVGKSKTAVLKAAIEKRASHVKISCINAMLKDYNSFSKLPLSDLMVVSGDSYNICKYANKYAFEKNIPFLNIGYIQDIAIWGPFIIPGVTPCYECFMKKNISDKKFDSAEDEEIVKSINRSYQAPSIGPVNMISAAHASLDILKYLGGFGKISSLKNRIGIWTDEIRIQKQLSRKQKNCNICNAKREIK